MVLLQSFADDEEILGEVQSVLASHRISNLGRLN